MSAKETQVKAQTVCSEILRQANLPAKIEAEASGEFTTLAVEIEFKRPLKEMASFVGALEYLLRLMLLQQGGEPKVLIDVNNYRRQRQAEIERLVAEKVAAVGDKNESVALPPMTAYDRRLVHQIVGESPGLKSESFGAGRNRRVIIKKREELG